MTSRVLAYGAMGGEGQLQTQVAMVKRLADFGCDVPQSKHHAGSYAALGAWSHAICGSSPGFAMRLRANCACEDIR